MNKVGLIAGRGEIPLLVKRELEAAGKEHIVIALAEGVADFLRPYCGDLPVFSPLQVGKVIKTLKKEKVTDVVFAGKVDKDVLLGRLRFDATLFKLIFKLKDFRDDTVMGAIREEFEANGINVLKQTEILSRFLAPKGQISSRVPDKEEQDDIDFGFPIAKKIGELDIGQTIIVRKRAVMAVEALEGTDKAIERGCGLAKSKAVVIKIKRPFQDDRFDIPTVGVDTLKQIADNKGTVLAVEAGSTFIVDYDGCRAFADSKGISFLGI
ncbi:UDP-2,3-diacylglucosamine diphosphatase LpxI [Geovibrio sp. ADMFC3]|nr:DUF1009 domain-containing protein [Deferribacteraceae bacterium]